MKIYRLAQHQFEGLIERLKMAIQDEKERGNTDWEIVIEPGQGETYSSGEPTVYFYGTYEDYSVLAGRQRRAGMEILDSYEEAKQFLEVAKSQGLPVSMYDTSGYVEDKMLDLPDEDGHYDPNYVPPTSLNIRDTIRDSEI